MRIAAQTQIAQNLEQIDSQLAGARDTQAGEQKTNEEMNKQTAAMSDALYEKREKLDALREETQNLRVTAGGLRTRRKRAQSGWLRACAGEQIALRRTDRRGAREPRGADLAAISRARSSSPRYRRSSRRVPENWKRAQQEPACASRHARNEGQETRPPADPGNRQPARDAGDGHGQVPQGRIDPRTHAERIGADAAAHLGRLRADLCRREGVSRRAVRYGAAATSARAKSAERFARWGRSTSTAMEDYSACRERYDDLASQRDDLVKAQDDLLGIIDSLQKQMEKQFMESFHLLQQYLSETFVKLFRRRHKPNCGWRMKSDVLGCGIDIVAQPPGKKAADALAALRRRTRADGDCDSVRDAAAQADAVLLP